MSQYKIYSMEVTQPGPVGVIITTSFFNPGGYPRAEYFLLLPDKQTLFSQKLHFDVKSFKNSPVALTEEFMLDEALQQAKLDLGLHLNNLAHSGGHPPPNVMEDNIGLLVHVWIKGTCPHLRQVHQKSEYEPLRDAILPILSVPFIGRTPL